MKTRTPEGTLLGAEGSGEGLGPYSKFDLVLKSWPSLCDPEREFLAFLTCLLV